MKENSDNLLLEQMAKAKAIKKKYEKSWFANADIVAVGIGTTTASTVGIIISVKENAGEIRRQIPATIEGVEIEIQETGEIKAQGETT